MATCATGGTAATGLTENEVRADGTQVISLTLTGDTWIASSSPYEDFTTFTEVDPGSTVSVAANTITVTQMQSRSTDTYVYKDYGAGYFDDFVHSVDTSANYSDSSDFCLVWGLSDTVNDQEQWNDGLVVYWFDYGTGFRLVIGEMVNTVLTNESYSGIIADATTVYPKITRTGTSYKLDIYSDAGRTSLIETVGPITVDTQTYQYLYALSSKNSAGSGYLVDATISNLDLTP